MAPGPVVILNVGESRNQHDQAADDEHQLHVDECQLKPERIGKRPGEHGPEKAQSLKQGHIRPVRGGLVAVGTSSCVAMCTPVTGMMNRNIPIAQQAAI